VIWLRRLVVVGTFALMLLGAGAYGWLQRSLAAADPHGTEQIFRVERGDTLGTVARNLAGADLVRDAHAVEWLARWEGLADQLRAGEYRLSPALTPKEILRRLAVGAIATYEIAIPEGFTAKQIAERLDKQQLCAAADFLAAVKDPALARELGLGDAGLEGYLFPETYRLPKGLEAREIAAILAATFVRVWRELEPLAAERGLAQREVVTLASIVEKETGAPAERPLIASVFANRLARGMRLESDPTTIYGIEGFDGNLRRAHLEDTANPYNTYRIAGLPPGPIANPGLAALRAVLEPAHSDYLYFVSRNDGTHQFSSNYQAHVLAVNSFQRQRVRN
jgi:UPF0755 protein